MNASALTILVAFMNGMATMMLFGVFLYFFTKRGDNRLKKSLCWIGLFWAVLFVKDALYLANVIPNSEYVYDLLMMIDLWVTPTCLFYVMELLSPGWLNGRRVLLYMSPYIIVTLLFVVTELSLFYYGSLIIAILYTVIALWYISLKVRRYSKRILDEYSNTEGYDVTWLNRILGVLIVCLIAWSFAYIYKSTLIDFFYYGTVVYVWLVLAYYTENHFISDNADSIFYDAEKPQADDPYFVTKLVSLQETDFFCVNPHLTLTELAKVLHTNRTTLSSYLNNMQGMSFHDFVNVQRLKHAEQLLKDESLKRLSQDELALKSGFNSLSTFRRAFLKHYGMSPVQYQKLYCGLKSA